MREALREARKGVGFTSPNPAVGAVLVNKGRVVSRAYHRQAGGPHAEVGCLGKLKGAVPANATLYVTMEPCCTQGKTGPCTDVIVRSGVRRVVIGALDPNPKHNGRGLGILRAAGIEVESGVLEAECTALNEGFNKWIVTGMPFVIAKCGMSMDGRLTRRGDELRWITGPQARRDGHRLRREVDAIIIGAETARQDDPHLTVRGVGRSKQPWRVILTSSGRLPAKLKLFRDRHKDRTLVYRKKSLRAVLTDLGKKNVTSVMIEGGGKLLGHALEQRLIDKVQFYVSATLTGGPVVAFGGRGAGATADGLHLEGVSYTRFGQDVRVAGYPRAVTNIS